MGNRSSKKTKNKDKDKKEEAVEDKQEQGQSSDQQSEDKKPECDQGETGAKDSGGDGGGGDASAEPKTDSEKVETKTDDSSKPETVEIKVTDTSGTTVSGAEADKPSEAVDNTNTESEQSKAEEKTNEPDAPKVEDKVEASPEAVSVPIEDKGSSEPEAVAEVPAEEPAKAEESLPPPPPEPLPVPESTEAASSAGPTEEQVAAQRQEAPAEGHDQPTAAGQDGSAEDPGAPAQEQSEADAAPITDESLPPPPPPMEETLPQENGINSEAQEPVANGDSLIPPSGGVSQTVEFKWEHGGEKVLVSGSFNDWKEQVPLEKQDDVFLTKLDLAVGEHLYKYIVDDEWVTNKNQKTKMVEEGTENNVVVVV